MASIEPMDAEFDTVAEWTAKVVEGLGRQYRIPAACPGLAAGRPDPAPW